MRRRRAMADWALAGLAWSLVVGAAALFALLDRLLGEPEPWGV